MISQVCSDTHHSQGLRNRLLDRIRRLLEAHYLRAFVAHLSLDEAAYGLQSALGSSSAIYDATEGGWMGKQVHTPDESQTQSAISQTHELPYAGDSQLTSAEHLSFSVPEQEKAQVGARTP